MVKEERGPRIDTLTADCRAADADGEEDGSPSPPSVGDVGKGARDENGGDESSAVRDARRPLKGERDTQTR